MSINGFSGGVPGNAALLLPSADAIRGPFIEIACSDHCLDPGTFHVVSNRIANTDKGNARPRFLQLVDETKEFISRTDVDEVDGRAIQKHTLDVWPCGQ